MPRIQHIFACFFSLSFAYGTWAQPNPVENWDELDLGPKVFHSIFTASRTLKVASGKTNEPLFQSAYNNSLYILTTLLESDLLKIEAESEAGEFRKCRRKDLFFELKKRGGKFTRLVLLVCDSANSYSHMQLTFAILEKFYLLQDSASFNDNKECSAELFASHALELSLLPISLPRESSCTAPEPARRTKPSSKKPVEKAEETKQEPAPQNPTPRRVIKAAKGSSNPILDAMRAGMESEGYDFDD